MKMDKYEIRATRQGKVSAVIFEDVNDSEATYSAIFRILDKANKGQNGLWAMGEVTLTNLTTGELLKTMKEKK